MKFVKNGNFGVNGGVNVPSKVVGDRYGCLSGSNTVSSGGVCGATNTGICPVGMIEVYHSANAISCQSWIKNNHKNECPAGYYQDPYHQNSIISGQYTGPDGIPHKSDHTASLGRPGCLIGYKANLVGNELKCDPIPGGASQKCRTGTQLTPIFEGGKLSFECRESSDIRLKTCYKAISGDLAGGAGEVQNCSEYFVHAKLRDVVTYPKPLNTSKTDDKSAMHCAQQKIGGDKDEFGRIIPTWRGTSMFLISDCRVCF